MLITETLHGEKFVQRCRELEANGFRFESIEVGESNASWRINYYSLPDDLFSTPQLNQEPDRKQKHERREAPPPAL